MWMNEQLEMFDPTTLKAIPSAIGLPESASGRIHSEKQKCQTIPRSGQRRAPANRLALRDKERGWETIDISGPSSSVWSESVALQESLVSKLRVKVASLGSTLYKMSWRQKATPRGWLFFRLVASGRRTCDSACIGLPKTQRLSHWPTPLESDSRGSAGTASRKIVELPNAVRLTCPDQRTAIGQTRNGSTAWTTSGDQLNPELPRWLLGIPAAWEDCAVTATRSWLNRRQRSSKP